MEIILTKHAEERLKDRIGLNKKSLKRNAQKAFDYGYKHSDVKGQLRKYVDKIYLENRDRNTYFDNIRIYGDKVYLFKENVLVTVMQIPANLTKNLKSMIKKEELKNGK